MSEVGNRYAQAIYELAVENNSADQVFAELRELEAGFSKDPSVMSFLTSPLVSAEERIRILEGALAKKGLKKETLDLLLLLARKGRFGAFSDVVQAFQVQADNAHNVARGTVRSASALGMSERQNIEAKIEKALNKKVILAYKVDPSVIGGLVAQVGSYTFDDSIASHLKRMTEELKRRTV